MMAPEPEPTTDWGAPRGGVPAPAPVTRLPSAMGSASSVRAPTARPRPLPPLFAIAVSALVAASLLGFWGWFYLRVLSSVQEHRAQHELLATFNERLAAFTAPIGGTIAQGAPVATLRIPSLGIKNLVVVEGTTSGDTEAGPGHRRDTPLPGEPGTSYVFGRDASFGAPFSRIGSLRKGSALFATTGDGTFAFRVDAVRRAGDPLSAFQKGSARLTLVTSESGRAGSRHVVYVDATLQGTPGRANAPAPVSLLAAERQMSGDPGAWLTISVLLEGLVVVAVVGAWWRVRWGGWPVVLVGAPLVVAGLWSVSSAASQVLPNIF